MIRIATALAIALSSLAAQAAMEVNKASQADLETVRGVGPGLSGKIIEARKAGEFKSWQDLVDRVSGIGPASATKLSQNGLTVAGAAYAAAANKPGKARSAKTEPASKPGNKAKDNR